jgi:hypothetical protein
VIDHHRTNVVHRNLLPKLNLTHTRTGTIIRIVARRQHERLLFDALLCARAKAETRKERYHEEERECDGPLLRARTTT